MTGRPEAITEDLLLAYVDGQLPPEARTRVDEFLARNPDRAAEVELWKRQNETLATLYGPVASEPVPTRLSPHRIAARRAEAGIAWRRMAAAAVVIFGLGGAGGWLVHGTLDAGTTPTEALIEGAVAAHALYIKESRHAVEVAGSDKAHLDTWLSNRIDRPIDAPDLTAEGFTLVGGRLLPPVLDARSGPAAQLMYENASADRLTVFVTASLQKPGKAYQFTRVAGLDAFYWSNDQITCTVVGDLPQDRMKQVAGRIYRELTWRPDVGS